MQAELNCCLRFLIVCIIGTNNRSCAGYVTSLYISVCIKLHRSAISNLRNVLIIVLISQMHLYVLYLPIKFGKFLLHLFLHAEDCLFNLTCN